MNQSRGPSTISGNFKKIAEKTSNMAGALKEQIKEKASNFKEGIQKRAENAKEQIQKTSDQSTYMAKGAEFVNSNTTISRFVFVMALFLLFMGAFNIGISLIQKYGMHSKTPILIDGMVSANKLKIISSNPNVDKSKPIFRSINQEYGLEYTWNVWVYIEDLNKIENNLYQRVFSKGSQEPNTTGVANPKTSSGVVPQLLNASPGLFITKNAADNSLTSTVNLHAGLVLVVNTFDSGTKNNDFLETIQIKNIPMKKWMCITIRVENTTVDIYLNGILTQRKKLNHLPRQNYYDTLIGDANNGFNGFISSLRYYDSAIHYDDIQSLYSKGPNRTSIDTSMSDNIQNYLSMNWYYTR
jgi:hypothetical protein